MIKKVCPIISLLVLMLFSNSFAEIDSLEFVGHWVGGPCQSVTADSSILFAGNGSKVEIFNISNPDSLINIGDFYVGDMVSQMEIQGSLLFVSENYTALSIYNISNPADPQRYSKTIINHNDFYIQNKNVYLSTGQGICVLDIMDPCSPSIMIEHDLYGAWGICAKDSIVYVGVINKEIIMLDARNTNEIVVLDTLIIGNDHYVSNTLLIKDDLLFAGTRSNAFGSAVLQVFDISEIDSPLTLGNIGLHGDWSSAVKDIYIEDSLAYITTSTDVGEYLRIVDIADSMNLQLRYTIEIKSANEVYIRNKLCYIADGSGGLKVYEWNTDNHTLIEQFRTGGPAYGLYVDNQYAFIASSSAGISAVDISDPENLKEIGYFDDPTVGLGSAYDIDVVNDYAYVINISGPINILNVSDPENISEVSWLHGAYGYALCVESDYLYVANRDYGLFVANISDPLNPVRACTLDVSSSAYDIVVKDTLLFLACAVNGTKIISISDPENPRIITTINTYGRHLGLCCVNDILYITEGENGLSIWNISNPINPTAVGNYCDNDFYFRKIQVSGNVAFVTENYMGIIALDVQDPSSISLLASSYKTANAINDLFLFENQIYATSGNDGLYIFKNTFSSKVTPVLATFNLYQNYPNPFNGATRIQYALTEQSNVNLVIYDITGRKIREWRIGHQSAGWHELIWNGTNNAGKGVSTGIYIYSLQADGFIDTKKMIFMK